MTEMQKLDKYLADHGVVHTYGRRWPKSEARDPSYCEGQPFDGGYQIVVYDDNGNCLWDAICGYGSFGFEQGLLEIMDEGYFGINDVVGFLTADDIIKKIKSNASNELVDK